MTPPPHTLPDDVGDREPHDRGCPPPPRALPDDATLRAALLPLVARAGIAQADVRIVGRRGHPCASSSPAEVVVVEAAGGDRRELFVKYGRPTDDPEPRCRRGVAYCARVYDALVARLPLPSVRALGLAAIGRPSMPALVLEHLADCLRVNEAPDDSGVVAAADWCGRLHAWGLGRTGEPALGFLARHDGGLYRAWAERALGLAAAAGPVPDWLARLCAGFAGRAAALAAAEATTIHGEFGPQNVLWKEGVVRPIDWESAAIGPGAIDLAALLFDWPAATVRRASDAYWQARGGPAPPGFAAAFREATVFTALRWLPDPAGGDASGWEAGLARLRRAAAGP